MQLSCFLNDVISQFSNLVISKVNYCDENNNFNGYSIFSIVLSLKNKSAIPILLSVLAQNLNVELKAAKQIIATPFAFISNFLR